VKKKQRKKETGSIWGVVLRSLLLPELLSQNQKKKTGRDRVARQKRVSPTHAKSRKKKKKEEEKRDHNTRHKNKNKQTHAKNTQKSEEARGYGDDDDCCCCCC
jgi:hypothetical protein